MVIMSGEKKASSRIRPREALGWSSTPPLTHGVAFEPRAPICNTGYVRVVDLLRA